MVFTAGILENSAIFRKDIINKLSRTMHIYLNDGINKIVGDGHELVTGVISMDDSDIPVWVVPTNEELMIVRDVYKILKRRELV